VVGCQENDVTEEIQVHRVDGDSFRVETRGHTVVVDQPGPGDGADSGPTPTELFVMSLASCVAFYAGRALGRGSEQLPLDVVCRWTMSAVAPWRVASVEVRVQPPSGLSASRLAAIARAVQHCTVHNSLVQPPEVTIDVVDGADAAA
jgi:putative redox protein